MPSSSAPAVRSRPGVTDKRAALLEAALELMARHGLQNVPTSAIARRAGVAKGTLFVYFETKEHLLNELYLTIATRFNQAVQAAFDPQVPPPARLRPFWFAFARWYLDHPADASVLLQCEVAAVLTPETQARKAEMDTALARAFFPDVFERVAGSSLRYVGYALIAGPIQALAQMRDKGEIEITDDLLEETFARVQQALQP